MILKTFVGMMIASLDGTYHEFGGRSVLDLADHRTCGSSGPDGDARRMIWKEFVEQVEQQGVTDDTIIRFIDIDGGADGVRVTRTHPSDANSSVEIFWIER